MKKIFNILMATALVLVVASCGKDDDFTESIFDTQKSAINSDDATAPFDKWLYENFVVPYNTEIQYKFNYPASNLEFQLAPADYKKSQLLAYFIKYLFYDVYNKYGGEDFMKKYGPRIFHFIGSPAYAPTTGTRTLGYASAGVKITLINVNSMKMWTAADPYTPADIDLLNEEQFHTMHHEFSHILHQTKTYPNAYGLITPGTYDPRDWQKRDSVLAHSLGYVTHYASNATYEDFVEVLSCTITDTDHRWMNTIIDACLNTGISEKQKVYDLIDSLEIAGLDDPTKPWNNFTIKKEMQLNDETDKYEETGRYITSFHENDCRSHAEGTMRYDKVQDFTSFRTFLNTWVPEVGEPSAGINAILTKIEMAKKWHSERWGLSLYQLRREVRQRQNNLNTWVKDNVTLYEYQ